MLINIIIFMRKGHIKMIIFELINSVRYPDESSAGINDKDFYYDVEEGLKLMIANANGQAKTDAQDTLTELQRRWAEKQEVLVALQRKWKERQLALKPISI